MIIEFIRVVNYSVNIKFLSELLIKARLLIHDVDYSVNGKILFDVRLGEAQEIYQVLVILPSPNSSQANLNLFRNSHTANDHILP